MGTCNTTPDKDARLAVDARSASGRSCCADAVSKVQFVWGQAGQLYRGVGSALAKSVLQAALLYMTKESVEGLFVKFFIVSSKMSRGRVNPTKFGRLFLRRSLIL